MAPAVHQGMTTLAAFYEVDARWRITEASDALCRELHCTKQGLIGRDIRDLLLPAVRHEFRRQVALALIGVGRADIKTPVVAPCGESQLLEHHIAPAMDGDAVGGFRATVSRLGPRTAARTSWWRQPAVPHRVWDDAFDHLAAAS